jgi:hypothetical protein
MRRSLKLRVALGLGIQSRPRSAGVHPAHEVLHHGSRQGLIGRHSQFIVRAADGLNQQTVIGAPRDNGRPALAAGEQRWAGIHAQRLFGLLPAVTTKT